MDVPQVGQYPERQMIFLGLDPGREKTGFALTAHEELIFSGIIPNEHDSSLFEALAGRSMAVLEKWCVEGNPHKNYFPDIIFVGDGTSSDVLANKLEKAGLTFTLVDESFSTLEGRRLYWRLHPPGFPLRFIPESLRVPPRPIDDMAAWAIIYRGTGKKFDAGKNI